MQINHLKGQPNQRVHPPEAADAQDVLRTEQGIQTGAEDLDRGDLKKGVNRNRAFCVYSS